MSIAIQLAAIQQQIQTACHRAKRDPATVRLLAVSKTKPASAVLEAMNAGQWLFGENRVQEAGEKIPLVGDARAEWHLIGPLQSNKVKQAVALFQMIHSVDSVELARAIGSRMAPGQTMPILVQVNVGGEAQKHGLAPEEAEAAIRQMAQVSGLGVRGLMTVPPYAEDPEEVRGAFRALASLARHIDQCQLPGVAMTELSMGMSHDFTVAIEEGATLIRVGSALFGSR